MKNNRNEIPIRKWNSKSKCKMELKVQLENENKCRFGHWKEIV